MLFINNKFKRHISGVIWGLLLFLPFVLAFIYFILYHLNMCESISKTDLIAYHKEGYTAFYDCIGYIGNMQYSLLPTWVTDPVYNLCNTLGFVDMTLIYPITWGIFILIIRLVIFIFVGFFNILKKMIGGVADV